MKEEDEARMRIEGRKQLECIAMNVMRGQYRFLVL